MKSHTNNRDNTEFAVFQRLQQRHRTSQRSV